MVAVLADAGPPPLESRIAAVMGVLNAASAELVSLIAEALTTGEWEGPGIRSAEHWVTLQCGVSAARASGLVASARGLAALPQCRELFESGALSEDQVRAFAGRVDAPHDREMAELAPYATVSQIRHAVSRLPQPQPQPQPPQPEDAEDGEKDDPSGEKPGKREVRFGYRRDGRWWCRMVLPGEEGAVIQAALEQARQAEFRARDCDSGDVTWSDAVARLAEAALTNLDPSTGRRPGERFQVYLHVRADQPLSAYLHLGPSVSDTVRRYLTCDAPIRLVFEEDGRIVALSEKQDTVDTKTRKLIEDRDRGCRVPGCGQVRWVHVHHIRHREDGGTTTLDNLCCLCPFHHRQHHAGLLEIRGDPTRPDGLEFITAGGHRLGPAPPKLPGAPPRDAARRLGIRDGRFDRPSGDHADWRWFWWS